MSATKQINVVKLVRVSTDQQDCERQEKITQKVCRDYGLNIKWSIEHKGVSGAVVRRTPETQRLIEILKSGKCDGAVMSELSRLMRPENFEDWDIAQVFKENKVKIYTPGQVYDLSNPTHSLTFGVQMLLSANERTTIRERTYGRRVQLRAQGKCGSPDHTLPPGIGFDREREVYFPDDTKGILTKVQRLFELFVKGITSFQELAKLTGLSYYIIGDTLSNTAYIGIRTYDEKRDVAHNVYDAEGRLKYSPKVKRTAEEIERIPMRGFRAEPILYPLPIDESVFNRAQQILAVKREQGWREKRSKNEDVFLFRGFLRCGVCNGVIIPFSNNSRQYYVCRNQHGDRRVRKDGSTDWRKPNGACKTARMRREKLEPIVEAVILKKLADPKFLAAAIDVQRKEAKQGDKRLQAEGIQREITEIEGEIGRLKILFRKNHISEDELDRETAKLESTLAAAHKAVNECIPTIPEVGYDYLTEIANALSGWDTLSFDQRRALLASACPVIKVTGRGNGGIGAGADTVIEVNGCYLLAPPTDAQASVTERSACEYRLPTVLLTTPCIYIKIKG